MTEEQFVPTDDLDTILDRSGGTGSYFLRADDVYMQPIAAKIVEFKELVDEFAEEDESEELKTRVQLVIDTPDGRRATNCSLAARQKLLKQIDYKRGTGVKRQQFEGLQGWICFWPAFTLADGSEGNPSTIWEPSLSPEKLHGRVVKHYQETINHPDTIWRQWHDNRQPIPDGGPVEQEEEQPPAQAQEEETLEPPFDPSASPPAPPNPDEDLPF